MFSDDTMICSTTLMSDLYDKHMEKKRKKGGQYDRFFYITIHGENTFG